jgi:Cft2 family RNA processing exonuclease
MAVGTFTRLTRAVEIGANCYALDLAGQRIVLDCGLHPAIDGPGALPQLSLLADDSVDAVIITHAHQDHIGALPALQQRQPRAQVFLSEATRQLSEVMLHNSVNVMHRRVEQGAVDALLFSHRAADQGMRRWLPLPLETRFDLTGERLGPRAEAGVAIEFFDAGHILGSVGVRIRAEGRTIFYTGDVQFDDQTISRAAAFPEEPVDVLIMECTRGDHAVDPTWTRAGEELRFAAAVREVFAAGGSVLVPTFALGKTQELLAMIFRLRRDGHLRVGFPIYIGGLGAKLTEIHDKLAGTTRRHFPNLRLLDEVAPFVLAGQSGAETIVKPGRIYALSSGMMTEHTLSNRYAEAFLGAPEHAVFFIGYCDPGSPAGPLRASALGEEVRINQEHPPVRRACRLEAFDFSGHATRESLRAFANRVRPQKILLVHGDPAAAEWMRNTLRGDLPGCEVLIPEAGEPVAV